MDDEERWLEEIPDLNELDENDVLRSTDLGNARLMVSLFGEKIRYCHIWKTWMIWNTKRWDRDDSGKIYSYADRVIRSILEKAKGANDNSERRLLCKHAMKLSFKSRQDSMISMAQHQYGIPIKPEMFDRDKYLFEVDNGTLNLHNFELENKNPDNYNSKLSPVVYDPDATCPRFEKFLSEIMAENSGAIQFIKRSIGYTITGDVSERCMFICHGPGSNGKTTLLNIFRALLGDYAQDTPVSTLLAKRFEGIPCDVAALKGARLVTAMEPGQRRNLDESLVKAMTGKDMVSARFMRENWFSFHPEFKLWLGTNHKPGIKGTDNAIWNRIRLIPFNVVIPKEKQIPHLDTEIILQELPGILNWTLNGCRQWQNGGLQSPPEITEATELYRKEMDTIRRFVDDCCIVDEMAVEKTSSLYTRYLSWCEKEHEKILSSVWFSRELSSHGFEANRTHDGRIFKGLCINNL